MEGLAPTLKCILEIELALKTGQPLKRGLITYIESNSEPFSAILRDWMSASHDQRQRLEIEKRIRSPFRRSLISLIDSGLQGRSIYKEVESLKFEVIQACTDDLESHIRKLPIKMLFPLLFLLFPSFLLLLLGPIVSRLMGAL